MVGIGIMTQKNIITKLITNKLYYYLENGFKVFTEEYHLKRGYCCKNGCRHCPYQKKDLTLNYEMERIDPLAVPTVNANTDKPE